MNSKNQFNELDSIHKKGDPKKYMDRTKALLFSLKGSYGAQGKDNKYFDKYFLTSFNRFSVLKKEGGLNYQTSELYKTALIKSKESDIAGLRRIESIGDTQTLSQVYAQFQKRVLGNLGVTMTHAQAEKYRLEMDHLFRESFVKGAVANGNFKQALKFVDQSVLFKDRGEKKYYKDKLKAAKREKDNQDYLQEQRVRRRIRSRTGDKLENLFRGTFGLSWEKGTSLAEVGKFKEGVNAAYFSGILTYPEREKFLSYLNVKEGGTAKGFLDDKIAEYLNEYDPEKSKLLFYKASLAYKINYDQLTPEQRKSYANFFRMGVDFTDDTKRQYELILKNNGTQTGKGTNIFNKPSKAFKANFYKFHAAGSRFGEEVNFDMHESADMANVKLGKLKDQYSIINETIGSNPKVSQIIDVLKEEGKLSFERGESGLEQLSSSSVNLDETLVWLVGLLDNLNEDTGTGNYPTESKWLGLVDDPHGALDTHEGVIQDLITDVDVLLRALKKQHNFETATKNLELYQEAFDANK